MSFLLEGIKQIVSYLVFCLTDAWLSLQIDWQYCIMLPSGQLILNFFPPKTLLKVLYSQTRISQPLKHFVWCWSVLSLILPYKVIAEFNLSKMDHKSCAVVDVAAAINIGTGFKLFISFQIYSTNSFSGNSISILQYF